MINVHQRNIPLNIEKIFSLLIDMGTDKDVIWPAANMPFVRTPAEMQVGVTKETHGIIKATLSEYVLNERIVWLANLPFLKGTHAFYLKSESSEITAISHVLKADLSWWFKPIWYFKVLGIHDRIIEGIFDRIEKVGKKTI